MNLEIVSRRKENITFQFFLRYLSALNISEKTIESNKLKENAIRTRARAEEKRERFKIVDNISRIIDDVALNYSANHQGEDMPLKGEKKKLITASASNWLEGEITVKSFAKITANSAPPSQQRARKSFPTPSSSKIINKQLPTTSISSTISCTTNTKKDSICINNKDTNNPVSTVQHLNKEVALISTPSIRSSTPISTSNYVAQNSNTIAMSPSILTSHSSTTTTVINSSVNATSIPTNFVNTKSTDPVGAMSHVILFPSPGVTYGSPIMNPLLGMVSKNICFLHVVFEW